MDQQLKTFLEQRGLHNVIKQAEQPLLDDKAIQRVEIIVLKYKSPEMEKDCVSRIIEYTKWPYKLNVFDNRGNGPNTAKAWNKLIKESSCDYVLFMDSDSFVQEKVPGREDSCWLTEMMKVYKRFENVLIVGPVCGTMAVTTMQSMIPKDAEPFNIDGHISGYCFLTKKSIYDELGYFDEDFCFYGQESDWIETALEKRRLDHIDYQVVIVPRAHVIHGYDNHGSQAAKQAQKEGEIDIGIDSNYSFLTWNMKKQQRMQKRGLKHEFQYS